MIEFRDGEGSQKGKRGNLGKIELFTVPNHKNLLVKTIYHYLHLNYTILLRYEEQNKPSLHSPLLSFTEKDAGWRLS